MNKQKVEIIGRVVKKPKMLTSKSDNSYARVDVAVNWKSKDKKGKEIDQVTYYEVLVFGKQAEKSKKFKKGMLLRVSGDLEIDAYLTKKGEPRSDVTVISREFQVLNTKIFHT